MEKKNLGFKEAILVFFYLGVIILIYILVLTLQHFDNVENRVAYCYWNYGENTGANKDGNGFYCYKDEQKFYFLDEDTKGYCPKKFWSLNDCGWVIGSGASYSEEEYSEWLNYMEEFKSK